MYFYPETRHFNSEAKPQKLHRFLMIFSFQYFFSDSRIAVGYQLRPPFTINAAMTSVI